MRVTHVMVAAPTMSTPGEAVPSSPSHHRCHLQHLLQVTPLWTSALGRERPVERHLLLGEPLRV